MTGHVCPECGVHRPGCACARAAGLAAEVAAAEDFDPLRIRPYVTLDDSTAHLPAYAPEDPTARVPAYAPEDPTAAVPAYTPEDPPTTQLAAIRPETGHPGAPTGDASETMPLLLRGIGDVPPAQGHATSGHGYGHGNGHDRREPARARGRKRGAVVAAVAAVAVAGTAALAAAVLGGADETDDRAAVPEVTTSASLNVAVSEAPSPSSSSATPEPTTSSPTPGRTSASPSATPSPSRGSASPSASASQAAPPAATASATPTATAPTTDTPSAQPPQETEEVAVTLNIGSTGAEVVELQARLTLAGAYHGDVDGEYDQEVWRAVRSYQNWMYIQGDPKGVYGPHTREALERSTWL
ncbi:peptidoglycan-binding protein [Streptomyces sp. NPDC096319]|uniref:peptidoglycan-binding domain-containing protein n=1 Tax=Streptomyces sp. NPDC096319 TaxID=3366084 RepID=UPI0037F78459